MSMKEAAILREVQALAQAGRYTDAKALLMKETRRGSTSALDNALAVVLLQLGELDLAEYHADRAASVKNANPMCVSTHANILSKRGKYDKAMAAFTRSLAGAPRYVPALLGMANTQWALNQLADAESTLRRALEIGPDPFIQGTLAAILVVAGRSHEGLEVAKTASARFPDDATAATSYANAANFAPQVSVSESLDAQRHYGRLLERAIPLPGRPPIRDASPERQLRIGFVSQDLRRHSVSYFFEPLLRHLDRSSFVPVCYSASAQADDLTERLRSLSSEFRNISSDSDARAVEIIRSDRIDVLIDLSGHTRAHRLEIFHRRPAPVQITYLGYPNITGLASIDARIVDSITDPPSPGESSQGPERLVRIDPPFICYLPTDGAPEVSPRPADRPITFGSFNAIAKLTAPTLRCWGRILAGVPGSRLLIKGRSLADQAARADIEARLLEGGADPARLDLRPDVPSAREHLALYDAVDVALDSFPYNGTTTTCEALWQGVPVISFTGDRHASRVSASLLTSIGCPELIASDVPGYERLAIALAHDQERLALYRATLRERMRASPLCDGSRLAASFGAAIRSLWREACAG